MYNHKFIVCFKTKSTFFISVLFLIVFFDCCSAGQAFLKDLYGDFSYLLTQKDFYQVVGGLGAVPYLFKRPIDLENAELTERWGESEIADHLFGAGDILGSGLLPATASVLIIGMGNSNKNVSIKEFGSDLMRAQIINGFVTWSMKVAINRKRPNGAPYSYPSGHTSTAFTTAGIVNHHFGSKYGIPAYLIASYVGLSRLQENKHYITDIVAGAAIGIYLSNKIVKRGKSSKRISLFPTSINDAPALGVTFKF